MPGDLVSALVDGIHGDPRRMTVLFFQHCGGASGRVADGATAFAHRYALANMMTVAGWPINAPAEDATAHIEATRRYWKTLEPFTRGFYVNDLAREVTAKEHQRELSRQLPAAGRAQDEARPDEPVPAERERHADAAR